jgi:hypothetical protein
MASIFSSYAIWLLIFSTFQQLHLISPRTVQPCFISLTSYLRVQSSHVSYPIPHISADSPAMFHIPYLISPRTVQPCFISLTSYLRVQSSHVSYPIPHISADSPAMLHIRKLSKLTFRSKLHHSDNRRK